MENSSLSPVTATLTKVLHRYNDLEIQETMWFANADLAADYKEAMLNKRVDRPVFGSPYTVTAVIF